MLRLTLLALLLTTPALAQELDLLGRHELSGRQGGRAFTGWLELRDDATYAGERRFDDGRIEALGGRAAIDRQDLVLTPTIGLAGALGGATSAPRRYARADLDRRVRWRFAQEGDEELLRLDGETERKVDFYGRLLRRPVLRWLFADNRGVVDEDLLRSRQPSPNDVVELIEEEGVRTIVSLNGDLDEPATLWEDEGDVPTAERVNLRDFIAARGVRHEVFRLGASRAPTDEELVAIFRVLLDDSKKPMLIHCRGGSDRTGIISALYAVEFLGVSKADAKKTMRKHLWMGSRGTEIQGAYLDLYQPGHLRALLAAAGVPIPERFRR
jgi:protein-tyrosine phosphatase